MTLNCTTTSPGPGKEYFTVLDVLGIVEVKSKEEWQQVFKDETIEIGTQLKVGKQGYIELDKNGKLFLLCKQGIYTMSEQLNYFENIENIYALFPDDMAADFNSPSNIAVFPPAEAEQRFNKSKEYFFRGKYGLAANEFIKLKYSYTDAGQFNKLQKYIRLSIFLNLIFMEGKNIEFKNNQDNSIESSLIKWICYLHFNDIKAAGNELIKINSNPEYDDDYKEIVKGISNCSAGINGGQ